MVKIQYIDNIEPTRSIDYTGKTEEHNGRVYKLGFEKGKDLSTSSRAKNIFFAVVCTFLSLGLAYLFPEVQKWWQQGIDGYQRNRVAVLDPDAKIAQKTDTQAQNKLSGARAAKFDPEQDIHFQNKPTSLRNIDFPGEIAKLLPKANYFAYFTSTIRWEDKDAIKSFIEAKKSNGLPIVILNLRFGEKAENISGNEGYYEFENQKYPMLNLRFQKDGYTIDDRMKKEVAEFKKLLD